MTNQTQQTKKEIYEAAKQEYRNLPSVRNWERMWEAYNDYEETIK